MDNVYDNMTFVRQTEYKLYIYICLLNKLHEESYIVGIMMIQISTSQSIRIITLIHLNIVWT